MNGLNGAYTLSLSGDAGFRVWTTTPAIGEPLLVGGRTVTNGVGVTFLSGDDTDLFVEAVSNGTATLTYAFAGSNISCAASLRMTAFVFESVEFLAAPINGIVVKAGEFVSMKANIFPEAYAPPEGEPKWYYQQMNNDGSWGSWTAFESSASGILYQYTATTGGIFRVKAVLTTCGQSLERSVKRTNNDAFSDLKEGDLDSFGVVNSEIQRTLRSTAVNRIGSTYYEADGALPASVDPFGLFTGNPKCNVFVADMCDISGANVDPPIDGVYLSGPYSANRWAGMLNMAIPNWALLPLNTKPQPGFVVASGRESGESGHCGIVDYDGRWISAGYSNVNRNAQFSDTYYWRYYESGVTNPAGMRVYEP